MALALTLTSSTSINQVIVAWTGGDGATTNIYRTTDSTLAADPDDAITAGTLRPVFTTTASSGSFNDRDVVSGLQYYYLVIDGTGSANANVTTNRDWINLIKYDPYDLLVDNQNATGAINTVEAISGGEFLYLVLVRSSTEMTESAVSSLVTASGRTGLVLGRASVPSVTAKDPTISVTTQIKFSEKNS